MSDTKLIGCTLLVRAITTGDEEIENLHIGNRELFGWSPTTIKKQLRGEWYVTGTAHSYPLGSTLNSELQNSPYAVKHESTYTLLVFLAGDFIPLRIWESIKTLVGMEKRNVWLIKSQQFTTRPVYIEHSLYRLSLCEPIDSTYIDFEHEQGDQSVQIFLHDTPLDFAGEQESELESSDDTPQPNNNLRGNPYR